MLSFHICFLFGFRISELCYQFGVVLKEWITISHFKLNKFAIEWWQMLRHLLPLSVLCVAAVITLLFWIPFRSHLAVFRSSYSISLPFEYDYLLCFSATMMMTTTTRMLFAKPESIVNRNAAMACIAWITLSKFVQEN